MPIKNVTYLPQYIAQKPCTAKNNNENNRTQKAEKDNTQSTMKKLGLLGLIVLGVSIYCESQRLTFPIFKGIVSRLCAKIFK